MDGSYDSNNIFQLLSIKGIRPAIKVRKNSRYRKSNHYFRNKTVKMQKNNYKNGRIVLAMDKDGLQKQYFHV
jgi:hypothetical protein